MKDFARIREIAAVLSRYGFEDVAGRLGPVAACRSLAYRLVRRDEPMRHSPAERTRMAIVELGATFVKLGQMLATRPDVLPPDFIAEFKKLHDDVPPFPFEQVRQVFESETGRPMSEVFESLDEAPLAAASIGQVHAGTLKDGRRVVVKVQRPGLESRIEADLRILAKLARILESRFPVFGEMRASAIVGEFRRNLLLEMDFASEVGNMVRYRAMFSEDPDVYVPSPVEGLCSRRVIVMDHVDGIKVTDKVSLEAAGVDMRRVVETGMRVILKSIFEFGFFHADPHPGNFFVLRNGAVALLDYGTVGTVGSRRIDEMAAFMYAVASSDVDMLVNVLVDMDVIGDDTDVRTLRADLAGLLARYRSASLKDVALAAFINESVSVMRRHAVAVPTDLLMVGKSIAIMEGVGREVCPDFKPIEFMQPYLKKVYVDRILDADRQTRTLTKTAMDAAGLLKDAPYDVRRILRRVRRGELSLVIRDADGQKLRADRFVIVNRAVFAAMSVAFFFGAALLVDSDSVSRHWFGMVSGSLSAVFFVCLLVSVLSYDGRKR